MALIINGTCDHVHMLIRIRPAQSIAEIARIVKTNSSGWIRKKGHKEFAWQAGYGVFSVSESRIAREEKTQGLRPGLHSFAASRLRTAEAAVPSSHERC